jgi:hypothetical protein
VVGGFHAMFVAHPRVYERHACFPGQDVSKSRSDPSILSQHLPPLFTKLEDLLTLRRRRVAPLGRLLSRRHGGLINEINRAEGWAQVGSLLRSCRGAAASFGAESRLAAKTRGEQYYQ